MMRKEWSLGIILLVFVISNTALGAEPLSSVEVSIPDYKVTTTGDLDYVEIPGGEILLAEEGRPRVPYYTKAINYPHGYMIQDVILKERSGLMTTTGLRLPVVILSPFPELPIEMKKGRYPREDYKWRVWENRDDSTTLIIMMYPFYYNPETTDVKFYKNYSFDISYIVSNVTITRLTTDKDVYQQGDKVMVDIGFNNSGLPQDVIFSALIKQYGSDEIVDGLPLRSLKDLAGAAFYTPQWDSNGFEPGYYSVEVSLKDTGGNVLDRKTEMFKLGISSGEITNFEAAPEYFDLGDNISINMTFNNTGTVDITGTAIIKVLNSTGDMVEGFVHNITDLIPSENICFYDIWNTSGTEEGSYNITGYVLYDGKATSPATDTVTTVAIAKKPDLAIADISLSDNKITYTIENQGNATAGPSTTYLYVDGTHKASDSVGSMPVGGKLSRSFKYTHACTPPNDTIKICADATNNVAEGNETNNCKTECWTCKVPSTMRDIYFADAKESPGSVYHYNTTTGIEETVYTRPSGQLYSFAFHPGNSEKLYYVNANEYKIYRTYQMSSGWAPEEVVYTHTTYVRDIAFAFDKEGKLGLYFSEATGAGGNGKIYKIEDGKASLYYEVKLADVGGAWAGDFTFDDKNNLYLSSGNRVPASIYKVEGEKVKEIFRDEKEPIKGLIYTDSALYYANWRTKIYQLDPSTGERTVVYSNSKRTWLSDVGFRQEGDS